MTDIVERLRASSSYVHAQAADEIDRLRAVEALYDAAKDQWNPVYKVVLDDRERLRDALRGLADAADDVGVKFFDTDTMDPVVERMQSATQIARAALERKP